MWDRDKRQVCRPVDLGYGYGVAGAREWSNWVDESGAERDVNGEIAFLRGLVAKLEARCAELDDLAHCDSLVPLPNRRGFLRQLELVIARLERYGDPAAVLFVDLDGLKMLNDSFGHSAGDEALIHVSSLLVGGVRQSDCVGRLGGDEFGILLDHADQETAEETAARLVNRVASEEFFIDGAPVPLSVAIGMTMIERGDTAAAVLARADQAMYQGKAAA
jgi:diguanylate cyclase (GGDEF)-like protein